MHAHLSLTLEHADARPRPASEQLSRDGQPEDPAPDNSDIAVLGRGGQRRVRSRHRPPARAVTAPGPPRAVAAAASTRPAPYSRSSPPPPSFRAVACRRATIAAGVGCAAQYPARDHERRGGRDVRRGHRSAFVTRGYAEALGRAPRERHLEDILAGRKFGTAVGIARKVCVRAAARSDEREPAAVVGVRGEAAVFGRGADADHIWSAGGIRDRRVSLVACGSHDENAPPMRVAEGFDQLGDVSRR